MIGRQEPTQAERLADHGHLLVRRAMQRDDWITKALIDLAAADQKEWTFEEWHALLAELDNAGDMTISEFLDFYT
jgi:hypothetical protein